MFGIFRHSHNCPNKMIDVGKRIIHPDTTFPLASEPLGCTNMCDIRLANAPEPPKPIAAPIPGYKSALSKVFGDDNVEEIGSQALAVLASFAPSYQPTQESAITADTASSPPLRMREHSPTARPSPDILVLQTRNTDEESIQDTAMTRGGGQNTDGTGIGASIHAPNTSAPESSPPEERRVRFSSLPPPRRPSTIAGTDSGNFTPETPKQRHTNDLWNQAQEAATTTKKEGEKDLPTDNNITTTTTNHPILLLYYLHQHHYLQRPQLHRHTARYSRRSYHPCRNALHHGRHGKHIRTQAQGNGKRPASGRNGTNNNNNTNNNRRPQEQQQQQQQQQQNPNPNTIQILQRPPGHKDNPKPPTTNNQRDTAPPNTTTTNSSIKQTWAAITPTGIDLDGFRLAPARKRHNTK